VPNKQSHRSGGAVAPAPVARSTRAPRIVHPHAVYLREEFEAEFRVKPSTVRREVREGRLRVCRRAGKYFFLGADILAWLRAGVVKPRACAPKANGASEHTASQ